MGRKAIPEMIDWLLLKVYSEVVFTLLLGGVLGMLLTLAVQIAHPLLTQWKDQRGRRY